MESSSGIKTWQWVVTVIVIIVLIIIGILVFGNDSETPDDTTPVDNTTSGLISSTESNRIVMSDQFPGNVVFVSSVQLENAGWVEIAKDNNGTPGATIGSAYFGKGINTGRVNLTEPTVEGGVYYAILHTDNGDKVFNATTDLSLRDSRGNVIMKIFRASAAVGAGLKG